MGGYVEITLKMPWKTSRGTCAGLFSNFKVIFSPWRLFPQNNIVDEKDTSLIRKHFLHVTNM